MGNLPRRQRCNVQIDEQCTVFDEYNDCTQRGDKDVRRNISSLKVANEDVVVAKFNAVLYGNMRKTIEQKKNALNC